MTTRPATVAAPPRVPAVDGGNQGREYVLHIAMTADDDTTALALAARLAAAAQTAAPDHVVGEPEPHVTDRDDWAEQVTAVCGASELSLPEPNVHDGPLAAHGVGRRLCTWHADARHAARPAPALSPHPVRALTATELGVDPGDDNRWAASVEEAIGLDALQPGDRST